MITQKTIKAYDCNTFEGFIDKMVLWLLEGEDVGRLISKLSPRQKADALVYLSGSHAEEHIVLSKMIRRTIK